jgi:acetyl/propionyl-CoA carboxylase alpha subunit
MEILVRINGQDQRVQAELIKQTLWIHFQGETWTLDTSTGRRSKKKSAGSSSDQIVAPMPGRVTKMLLLKGQKVEKGQAVLVMEAMKMEYTLKAEMAGDIQDVHCTVGDQVTLGKVLVQLGQKVEA